MVNNEVNELLKNIYGDYKKKKNEYKIKIDDLRSELEIINRSIDYCISNEDESKLFSPRTSGDDNTTDSIDDMESQKEQLEKNINDFTDQYKYYNDYCKKLKNLLDRLKEDENEKNIKKIDDSINENSEKYSLNLNYDNSEIKNKLSVISHRLDVCLKIFNSDTDRAKNEVKSISKQIRNMIKDL